MLRYYACERDRAWAATPSIVTWNVSGLLPLSMPATSADVSSTRKSLPFTSATTSMEPVAAKSPRPASAVEDKYWASVQACRLAAEETRVGKDSDEAREEDRMVIQRLWEIQKACREEEESQEKAAIEALSQHIRAAHMREQQGVIITVPSYDLIDDLGLVDQPATLSNASALPMLQSKGMAFTLSNVTTEPSDVSFVGSLTALPSIPPFPPLHIGGNVQLTAHRSPMKLDKPVSDEEDAATASQSFLLGQDLDQSDVSTSLLEQHLSWDIPTPDLSFDAFTAPNVALDLSLLRIGEDGYMPGDDHEKEQRRSLVIAGVEELTKSAVDSLINLPVAAFTAGADMSSKALNSSTEWFAAAASSAADFLVRVSSSSNSMRECTSTERACRHCQFDYHDRS